MPERLSTLCGNPTRDCQRGLKNASRRKFKRNTKFLGIKSDSDDRRDH